MSIKVGKVYLVGAGPGDPGLITLKGFEVLQQAEIIFYDNLVNPKLLEFAPPKTKLVYVGKRGEGTSTEQRLIEDQLVATARKGKRVVRLKGGDPFIFGRGGEEAERLTLEKIPYEIVPGVSSTIAVPAYAGIPLTHRDFTSTVAFVTGHPKEDEPSRIPLDWQALAKMGTLVFVMAVKKIKENMQHLIEAGCDPKTPAAIIRWGTYPRQQTLVGTVATIADEVLRLNWMPPAVLVIGEVVRLRETIRWFELKPLFGKKIVVTRGRHQAESLSQKLEDLGASIIEIPTIEIVAPASYKEINQAFRKIHQYDRIIFTSVNAVSFFVERLRVLDLDIRVLASCRLAAVGSATAEALTRLSLKVDKIPEHFDARSLGRTFSKREVRGKKILIPRSAKGREDLIQSLKEKGARVQAVTVYDNRLPKDAKEKVEALTKLMPVDLITFTSSSTAENFYSLLDSSLRKVILQTPCLCIGPVTAETVERLKFKKVHVSPRATIEGMMSWIIQHLR